MKSTSFINTFSGNETKIPVWFMRQAGRYLPQYRAIKDKYSLEDMFRTPDLAAEITVQPVRFIGVDAAILFADILTLPAAMGFDIKFDNREGPKIAKTIASVKDIEGLHNFDNLSYVVQTISRVKAQLPKTVPLIGFAGSPFTVATYLIEGGSSISFTKTLKFMAQEPKAFHMLMELLTQNTVAYLQMQKAAGIDAFQLFDTWGGILPEFTYKSFVHKYIQEIFEKIDLPSIYFLRNTKHLLPSLKSIPCQMISVDQTVDIGEDEELKKLDKGVQGNLFNGLLYAPRPVIQQALDFVLRAGLKHKSYIFNLNHGVFPDVNPDTLKWIVEHVHRFNPEHKTKRPIRRRRINKPRK